MKSRGGELETTGSWEPDRRVLRGRTTLQVCAAWLSSFLGSSQVEEEGERKKEEEGGEEEEEEELKKNGGKEKEKKKKRRKKKEELKDNSTFLFIFIY